MPHPECEEEAVDHEETRASTETAAAATSCEPPPSLAFCLEKELPMRREGQRADSTQAATARVGGAAESPGAAAAATSAAAVTAGRAPRAEAATNLERDRDGPQACHRFCKEVDVT